MRPAFAHDVRYEGSDIGSLTRHSLLLARVPNQAISSDRITPSFSLK